MQGLIADTGEPWSQDINWADPSQTLKAALADTTRLGILQVHSAVDSFVEDVNADISRWYSFQNHPFQSLPSTDPESDPLEKLYVESLGGDSSDFDDLRPLLRYFRLARNCIAHRSGRTSAALSLQSCKKEMAVALSRLQTKHAPPPIPELVEDSVIEVLPRLAILALTVAHRAAGIVNRKEVQVLGIRGLTHQAAHYSLLQGIRLDGATSYRSPQAVLADTLASRYRVHGASGENAIAAAKRIDVWADCRRAFAGLYGVKPTKL